jgi:hypothetical protein
MPARRRAEGRVGRERALRAVARGGAPERLARRSMRQHIPLQAQLGGRDAPEPQRQPDALQIAVDRVLLRERAAAHAVLGGPPP